MSKKEKENQVQAALGTMKRQMFVSADWKDIVGLLDDFEKALENFGLFMYDDPDMEGSDHYAFVISNEQLTDDQINKLCGCEDDNLDDECDGCEHAAVCKADKNGKCLKY